MGRMVTITRELRHAKMCSWLDSWSGCFAASFYSVCISLWLSFIWFFSIVFTFYSLLYHHASLASFLCKILRFWFYLPLNRKSSVCCLQWLSDGYFLYCFPSYFCCLSVMFELFLYSYRGAFTFIYICMYV